ncbi:MAG: hypothetical protein ABSG80_07105 [Verrucomicrobiota bacterium]
MNLVIHLLFTACSPGADKIAASIKIVLCQSFSAMGTEVLTVMLALTVSSTRLLLQISKIVPQREPARAWTRRRHSMGSG